MSEQPALYEKVIRAFYARFQRQPHFVVRAPGRVNLIGEHTDYNDGFVMPVAVDRAAWLAVAADETPLATVRALDMRNDEVAFTVAEIPSTAGGWADYPKGVAWAFLERGLRPTGLSAALVSDVPVGAGMSSSAAVELAFATAWNHLGGFGIAPHELALMCQRAENQYVGVNCGIMDQMISACGKARHAMFLDTRTLERNYCPLPEGVALVVADSLVRRSLANSEYNVRRGQCEQAAALLKAALPEIKALRDVTPADFERHAGLLPDVVRRRARHVIYENARVLLVTRALYQGDMQTVREYMIEGHRSLRDDYEVSAPELDVLAAAAVEIPGCYGARLTGAGFGGCVVALAAPAAVSELTEHLRAVYTAQFAKTPAVYVTYAADGASVVQ